VRSAELAAAIAKLKLAGGKAEELVEKRA